MSNNKYYIITDYRHSHSGYSLLDSLIQAKGCDSLWELRPFLLLNIDIYCRNNEIRVYNKLGGRL